MRWTERQRAMLREMGVVLAPERPAAPSTMPAETGAAMATAAVAEPRSVASAASASAVATRPVEGKAVAAAAAAAAAPSASATPIVERQGEAARPATAQWLVVGEPLDGATTEEAALLDNMLRAIGLARSGGGRSAVARFVDIAAWASTPADETAACVLVLGRAAAEAVLGSAEPLGALRGRLHAWRGRPVVVTFSPAYLLRHPADKAKAWADLCLAVQAADG